MARPRLELQTLLEAIPGVQEVYFQPPNQLKMVYPCIIYNREEFDSQYADNLPYRQAKRYTITIIDSNPDSAITDKVAKLPYCTSNRFFVADNLNHDVFTMYF